MSGTVNRFPKARQCRAAAGLQSLLVPRFQTMVPSGFPSRSLGAAPTAASRAVRHYALPHRQPALSKGLGVDIVEGGDDEIGVGRGQQVGVVGSCDADGGHTAGFGGLDRGGRVLGHDRVAWLGAELVRGGQEDLGVGFTVEVVRGGARCTRSAMSVPSDPAAM
jgi:hypothetical protein